MRRIAFLLATGMIMSACAVNQQMRITRSTHYDENGRFAGYTVEEQLIVPRVARPIDREVPNIKYFETGNTFSRKKGHWPPRSMSRSMTKR